MQKLLTCVALCALLASCDPRETRPRRLPGTSTRCAWQVCVRYLDSPTGREYVVSNDEPVPATVALDFRAVENLRPPPGNRVERVVAPHESVRLTYLRVLEPDRPKGARMAIEIDLGSSDTVPDDVDYAVPFGGFRSRQLIQGYDGAETHMASMRYSLDFAMPRGTPVLAARGGIVLLVQDGFTEGGLDPDLLERANLVVVAHEDGTMASYGHLQPGVAVHSGDTVSVGTLLGRSGATGFAGQPHLHFHVGNRMLGERNRTIPIRMVDRRGREIDLEDGAWVDPGQIR